MLFFTQIAKGWSMHILLRVTPVVTLLVVPLVAFAQSDSIGGSLGKTDKSASGGEPAPEARKRAALKPAKAVTAREASCRYLVGAWIWSPGTTIFAADGSERHSSGATGAWTCKDGVAIATWNNGFVDTIRISPDGKTLSIENNMGRTFSVTRM